MGFEGFYETPIQSVQLIYAHRGFLHTYIHICAHLVFFLQTLGCFLKYLGDMSSFLKPQYTTDFKKPLDAFRGFGKPFREFLRGGLMKLREFLRGGPVKTLGASSRYIPIFW